MKSAEYTENQRTAMELAAHAWSLMEDQMNVKNWHQAKVKLQAALMLVESHMAAIPKSQLRQSGLIGSAA